tara:strand:+ start:207 stop:1655 length:1449 start_codon:yes stop_codon:yes gene_type:complete
MNFFKSLKSRLLGSVKEDLNSALSGGRLDFNSKIEDALKDLISLKTGIRLSNVPSIISEQASQNAENRRAIEKNLGDSAMTVGVSTTDPKGRDVLRFPTDNNRFVDNWIIFRTIPKNIKLMPHAEGDTPIDQQSFLGDRGVSQADSKFATKDYTIALYFPNNVKDTVSVSYEAVDIGLNDVMFNTLMNEGIFEAAGDIAPAVDEAFAKAARGLDSTRSFQTGVVAPKPKFNTFSGVEFRDHSYTFQLNPYNVQDAKEITRIIHVFKMMMLPMPLADNKRLQAMPAEFSINFKGPILGNIEHPQNCFLKSCDVDYSGGKDMSFIEDNLGYKQEERGFQNEKIPKHYPNGITLSLVFQEILNLDRLRYHNRVSAAAKGNSQNVDDEIRNFETELEGGIKNLTVEETNEYNKITTGSFFKQETYGSMAEAQEVLTRLNLAGEYEVRMQTSPGRSHDQNLTQLDIDMYKEAGYNVTPKYRIFKKGD